LVKPPSGEKFQLKGVKQYWEARVNWKNFSKEIEEEKYVDLELVYCRRMVYEERRM